jgi:hypothetical protein
MGALTKSEPPLSFSLDLILVFYFFKKMFSFFSCVIRGPLCGPLQSLYFLAFLKPHHSCGSITLYQTTSSHQTSPISGFIKAIKNYLNLTSSNITVLKTVFRFLNFKAVCKLITGLREWRKVLGYIYFLYHRRFMNGYPQPQVFSANPIGLTGSRLASGCSAKIPEYRDTVISWLGRIAIIIDKSNDLTNRIFCCIIFTLAKQGVKNET